MPKFRYRMQNILDIKLKIEEQAKNEFAQAQIKYNEELEKRKALVERLAGYENEARAARSESLSVRELKESEQAISIMKGYIVTQDTEVKKAIAVLESKRSALREVMQERKMHEKLREKALAQYMEEEKATEAKTIDELTSYTHGRK